MDYNELELYAGADFITETKGRPLFKLWALWNRIYRH